MSTQRLQLKRLKNLAGENTWSETATATNGTATATHSATAGSSHGIYGIIVDYDDAAADRAVTVKFGGTTQFQFNTTDKRIFTLPIPLLAAEGEAVSVEAAAGGTGIDGRITIIGTTIDT